MSFLPSRTRRMKGPFGPRTVSCCPCLLLDRPYVRTPGEVTVRRHCRCGVGLGQHGPHGQQHKSDPHAGPAAGPLAEHHEGKQQPEHGNQKGPGGQLRQVTALGLDEPSQGRSGGPDQAEEREDNDETSRPLDLRGPFDRGGRHAQNGAPDEEVRSTEDHDVGTLHSTHHECPRRHRRGREQRQQSAAATAAGYRHHHQTSEADRHRGGGTHRQPLPEKPPGGQQDQQRLGVGQHSGDAGGASGDPGKHGGESQTDVDHAEDRDTDPRGARPRQRAPLHPGNQGQGPTSEQGTQGGQPQQRRIAQTPPDSEEAGAPRRGDPQQTQRSRPAAGLSAAPRDRRCRCRHRGDRPPSTRVMQEH